MHRASPPVERVRCCARCERVYWYTLGDCPDCGFASYGARFVYGDWAYLYVGWRLVVDWLAGLPAVRRLKNWWLGFLAYMLDLDAD